MVGARGTNSDIRKKKSYKQTFIRKKPKKKFRSKQEDIINMI